MTITDTAGNREMHDKISKCHFSRTDPFARKNMSEESMSNFTPRAQQSLALARKEADRLNHDFLAVEHLLLGIIKLGQGGAISILSNIGVDLIALRKDLETRLGPGLRNRIIGNIPYKPSVKKVIALAQKEAKYLNDNHVGTKHILLGIIREGNGKTAQEPLHKELTLDQCRELAKRTSDRSLAGNIAFIESRMLGHHKSLKPKETWLDSLINQLPEVKMANGLVEDLKLKKETAIKNQDFEGAAQMRDSEKTAKVSLDNLIKKMRERLLQTNQQKLDPELGQFFSEVPRESVFSSFTKMAEIAASQLLESHPLSVVCSHGNDPEMFLRHTAASLFGRSLIKSTVPHLLIVPNHLRLAGTTTEQCESNFEKATEILLAHKNLILWISEPDVLIDKNLTPPHIGAAWYHTLVALLNYGVPFIFTQHKSGANALSKVWPGLMAKCKTFEIPILSRNELVAVLESWLMKEHCCSSPKSVNEIATFIVDASQARNDPSISEPGKSIALCDNLVKAYRERAKPIASGVQVRKSNKEITESQVSSGAKMPLKLDFAKTFFNQSE